MPPVPRDVPPVGTLYQLIVPLPITSSCTAFPKQNTDEPVTSKGAAGAATLVTNIFKPLLQVSAGSPKTWALKMLVPLVIGGVVKVADVPNTGPFILPIFSAHSMFGAFVVMLSEVVLPWQTCKLAVGVMLLIVY